MLDPSAATRPDGAADATAMDADLTQHVSVFFLILQILVSGARTALPMGVAPEDVRD